MPMEAVNTKLPTSAVRVCTAKVFIIVAPSGRADSEVTAEPVRMPIAANAIAATPPAIKNGVGADITFGEVAFVVFSSPVDREQADVVVTLTD